jgi:hypothetical protein
VLRDYCAEEIEITVLKKQQQHAGLPQVLRDYCAEETAQKR